jgi:hypothetical protein
VGTIRSEGEALFERDYRASVRAGLLYDWFVALDPYLINCCLNKHSAQEAMNFGIVDGILEKRPIPET